MLLSTSLAALADYGATALSHPWLVLIAFLVLYLSVTGYIARRRAWVRVSTLSIFNRDRSRAQVDCPTIGFSNPILSYLSLIKQLRTGRLEFRKAYNDHYDQVCKVPAFDRWIILVCGKKLVEEVSNFPDEVASLFEASRVVSDHLVVIQRD
jgi:hypothetical protein